jgi:hypothetical protein
MKSNIFKLVLFFMAFCCSTAMLKSETAQQVSYCDLVKEPQQFAGKRIRVRAIYKYGFEIQRLDSPVCCPERRTKIWVEIESKLEGNSLKLYRKFPRDMGLVLATFEGKFESGGPYGDGGYRLQLMVEQIEKLEAVAKASAQHDPAWVPKNCEKSITWLPEQNTLTVLHEAQHAIASDQSIENK